MWILFGYSSIIFFIFYIFLNVFILDCYLYQNGWIKFAFYNDPIYFLCWTEDFGNLFCFRLFLVLWHLHVLTLINFLCFNLLLDFWWCTPSESEVKLLLQSVETCFIKNVLKKEIFLIIKLKFILANLPAFHFWEV